MKSASSNHVTAGCIDRGGSIPPVPKALYDRALPLICMCGLIERPSLWDLVLQCWPRAMLSSLARCQTHYTISPASFLLTTDSDLSPSCALPKIDCASVPTMSPSIAMGVLSPVRYYGCQQRLQTRTSNSPDTRRRLQRGILHQ